MKTLGLALGGGGVRGLAHIPALQILDELDLRPDRVAGTSMGAIIGALYASGRSGKDILNLVNRHIISRHDRLPDVLAKKSELLKWLGAITPDLRHGGLLRADGFLAFLIEEIGVTRFEDLPTPLTVVATDFWTGQQVLINQGELLPAVKASMAIPGVFTPVTIGDQVLVDGGVVNNVPFDILAAPCDRVIAIDVGPTREPGSHLVPTVIESLLGMFDIMCDQQTQRKLARTPPTLYVHPELRDVTPLEFNKIESVLDQAEPAMRRFRESLRALISGTE